MSYKNSSEFALNISEQPDNFCNYIDPAIAPLNANLANTDELYNFSRKDFATFDLNLLKDTDYSSLKFEALIDEMTSWFSGWLLTFFLSINKEEDLLFKEELASEYILFRSQFDIFKKNSFYFKSEEFKLSKNISDSIKKAKLTKNNYINSPIENLDSYECSSLLYEIEDAINDVNKYSNQLIELFEFLRRSADRLRCCANDDLKNKTKVQLIRVKDEKFKIFVEKNESKNREFKRLAYRNDLISVNKQYMLY